MPRNFSSSKEVVLHNAFTFLRVLLKIADINEKIVIRDQARNRLYIEEFSKRDFMRYCNLFAKIDKSFLLRGEIEKGIFNDIIRFFEDLGVFSQNLGSKNNSGVWSFEMNLNNDLEKRIFKEYDIPSAKVSSIDSTKYNLPYTINFFIGHKAVLKKIKAFFNDGIISHKFIILTGIAGIGKTTLALKYLQSTVKTYSAGICWLDAQKDIVEQVAFYMNRFSRLEHSIFMQYVNINNINSVFAHIKGKLLIVLDNIEEEAILKKFYSFANENIHIIATSIKHFNEGNLFKNQVIILDMLALHEAVDLLIYYTATINDDSDKVTAALRIYAEIAEAYLLCDYLGRLPLAIRSVGIALSRDNHLKIKEILQVLQVRYLKTNFLEEYDKILTQIFDQFDEETKHVAMLLGLFAPVAIDWEFVEGIWKELKKSNIELIEARTLLLKHRFISEKLSSGNYQIHPLIQTFCLQNLLRQDDNKKHKDISTFSTFFIAIISISIQCKKYDFLTINIAHLENIYSLFYHYLSDSKKFILLSGMMLVYRNYGYYEKAVVLSDKKLDFYKNNENTSAFAVYLNEKAELFLRQQQYIIALEILKKADNLIEKFPDKQMEKIAIYINLASAYKGLASKENIDKAISYYKDILEFLDSKNMTENEKKIDIGHIFNNLAIAYADLKDWENAILYCQKALDEIKDDYQQAVIYNNWGYIMKEQKELSKAEEKYQKAVNIFTKIQTSDVIAIRASFNLLRMRIEQNKEKNNIKQKIYNCLFMLEKRLPSVHPWVLEALELFRKF